MVNMNDGSEECEGKVCLNILVNQAAEPDEHKGMISLGRDPSAEFTYKIRNTREEGPQGYEDLELDLTDRSGMPVALDGDLSDIFKGIVYSAIVHYQESLTTGEGMVKAMIAGAVAEQFGAEMLQIATMKACVPLQPKLEEFLKNYDSNRVEIDYVIDPTGGNIQ